MAGKNFTNIAGLFSKNKKNQPAVTVGGAGKERELSRASKENSIEIQEVVEHEPGKEVRSFVQKRAESIHLPPDLKKLGIQSSSTTTSSSYQNIHIPISDDKVLTGLHAPITSSIRWLATLALYLLHKAHVGLKTVHGHAVRIFRR